MGLSIVGIGGSVDPDSQSERALHAVLRAVADRGGETTSFTGAALELPAFHSSAARPPGAGPYIEAIRAADAVVIASPGYHGTVSGLVKNALDYLEELRGDTRPYLDGRAVGLVAVARGWQAAVGTLTTLRQITHSLRGTPTPFGLTVNSAVNRFDEANRPDDPTIQSGIDILAEQLLRGTAG